MSFSASASHASTATPAPAAQRLAPLSGTHRIAGVRVTPYRLLILVLILLAGGFYMWTAATSVGFDFSSSNNDLYNELTTSFLHGHSYLPITPPAGLLQLKDPYDPAQNAAYSNGAFHDLSLYHGHFYSQWGPTPVLTLFAPFRLTGLRMSEPFAAALYGFIGLVCAFLLLRALVQQLVPTAPRWLLPVSLVGLALTNTVPFLLRRPIQYEVAIACGYCFGMAGLWLMVTAVLGPELRRWRMVAGSLCLGLAVGARPTLAVGGAVAVAAAIWEQRRRTGSYRLRVNRETLKLLTYALGPFVVCGLLLALYNHVRFGAFTNFGERYELAGIDQTKAQFYSLSYVVPGLVTYLLLPARVVLAFPHFLLRTSASLPFSLPSGYAGGPSLAGEPTGGVFATMPITLLLVAIVPFWRWRAPGERRPLVAAAGLTALGILIATLVSWALFGTTERYEVDFVTFLLIPAFLLWAMLLARARPKTSARRTWAVVGIVLTLIGALIGTAISFTGYSNLLQTEHPATFNALEDVTGPFATVATMIGGKPQIARIDDGSLPVTPLNGRVGFSEDHASAYLGNTTLSLMVLSPDDRRAAVVVTPTPGPGAPPLSKVAIRISGNGRSATVPASLHQLRLPVSLHWGLNRVHLTIAGTPTSPTEVLLSDIELSS
jgi:hypothetical protein